MIRMLVGLGNPGPEYERTRHNAGFWWLEDVARKLSVNLQRERAYDGLLARVNLPDGPVWLLEPQTFMNLSGKSVSALARFYKIAPEEILVAHDELDLPPGTVKMKQGGGHAGHNGLRDINAQLGSPNYWRLRIGIGHPGVKDQVLSYVLGKPQSEQQGTIDDSIARTMPAVDAMLKGDMAKATMLVHAKPAPPKAEPKPADRAAGSATGSPTSSTSARPPAPAPSTLSSSIANALSQAFGGKPKP
jgi:PTH1 family peptidyl-tRNA hydrolase